MTAVRSVCSFVLGLVGVGLVVLGSALAGHPGIEVQYLLAGGLCLFAAFVLALGRAGGRLR